jgi:hypothetical protein
MSNYEPNWEAIANKWSDVLHNALSWTVYYPYPPNAVDSLELPTIIINEPQNIGFGAFTFKALTISYTGELSLLAMKAENGVDAAFSTNQIHAITAAALNLNLVVHRNRHIPGFATHISLGEHRLGFLNPYDQDARGFYAGAKIPYTIQMQYGSGL